MYSFDIVYTVQLFVVAFHLPLITPRITLYIYQILEDNIPLSTRPYFIQKCYHQAASLALSVVESQASRARLLPYAMSGLRTQSQLHSRLATRMSNWLLQ